jgi:hypothetical protein
MTTAETAANANIVTSEVVEYLIIIRVNQVSTADNRKRSLVTRNFHGRQRQFWG